MKTILQFCNLVLLALILQNSVAQSYQETLENIATTNNLTGMSVLVMCNGEISNIYHYGYADIDREIPISDRTYYRIASISKTVTATALMTLYDNDAFRLNDDINEYLNFEVSNPYYPDKKITFQMLLSHTAGLRDGSAYSNFLTDSYNSTPVPHISELLTAGGNYYSADMWANHSPGHYFAYSNINYGLIATLIEQISNQRFDLYVRDSVLQPLGITGSFNVNHLTDINNVAVLYRNAIPQADHYEGEMPDPFDSANYTIGTNGVIFAPQGGLRITIPELYRFMAMHANDGLWQNTQLLNTETASIMHTPVWTYNGNNGYNYYNLFNSWGLGMQITTNTTMGDIVIPATQMIGHPGEAYGLISDMYFEKTRQFGLIFMTNGYYSGGYNFGDNSAFYVPEEKIFEAIAEHHFPQCDTINSGTTIQKKNHQQKPFYYKAHSHTIHFNHISQKGILYIYNLEGENVFRKKTNSTRTIQLPKFQQGIYLIKWSNTKQSYTLKQPIIRN